jgi:Tetracyclin repressor-like, C-terminal domain
MQGEESWRRQVPASSAWPRAAIESKAGPQPVAAVTDVYLSFAATHPSLYEAMFQLPIDARFAQDDTETELCSAFNALGAALGNDDGGTATLAAPVAARAC